MSCFSWAALPRPYKVQGGRGKSTPPHYGGEHNDDAHLKHLLELLGYHLSPYPLGGADTRGEDPHVNYPCLGVSGGLLQSLAV